LINGGTVLCVAEIGIYRCSEAIHLDGMNTAEERATSLAKGSEEVAKMLRQHFADREWTPWLYNQAVAWLRVYAYPRKCEYSTPCVNAEYYAIDAKRLSPTLKRKRFLWAGEAFSLVIEGEINVFDCVSEHIQRWARSAKVVKLTLDLAVWNNVGPLIDWNRLLCPRAA
jgi:hypothetical protein